MNRHAASAIHRLIDELHLESTASLKDRYASLFGEPTRTRNRQFLIKRIAWRTQSLAHGGLSERARSRALALARDADLRTTLPRPRTPASAGDAGPGAAAVTSIPLPPPQPRLPLPGTTLTRVYRGRTLCVMVLADGFEFEGRRFQSLSAIAKAVTGTHWNGFHFFHLRQDKR